MMEDRKPVYLVMVTTNNNNKYYRMLANDNGTFTVEYGRVGASCQTRTYPISQWDKKYNEKIRKGYVDQTHLVEDLIKVQKPKVNRSEYREIEDKAIAEIVDRLMRMAHQRFSKTIRLSPTKLRWQWSKKRRKSLIGW